ncbi:hypothetical protein I552_3245 [Mycobacterium xenopi 3993]|nr:hypothetical protein I552_3245 [Mycobacterium xenopi 3993]
MLLHVARDRAGRRRLAEIAVLRQSDCGRVDVVTVWQARRGLTDAADDLRRLLDSRMST